MRQELVDVASPVGWQSPIAWLDYLALSDQADDAAFADALLGQSQDERVELLMGQRLLHAEPELIKSYVTTRSTSRPTAEPSSPGWRASSPRSHG